MISALSCLPELELKLRSATSILLATDFDGTLCPIARTPVGLTIPPVMLEVLRQLTGSGRVSLAVISGRALSDLACRVPLPAALAGNHGLEIRGPGVVFEHPDARRLAPLLAEASAALSKLVARWPCAWVEDKTLTLTVHYREAAGCDQAAILPAVRREMCRFGMNFGMRAGKKAIEIYPRVGWQKGSALTWIREHMGLETGPCVCVGDDRTDESMFAANADGINVSVGYKERSAAHYYVTGQDELTAVFTHLAWSLVARPAVAVHAATEFVQA